LVALLVSVGAQLLAESLLPAGIGAWFGPESPGVPHSYRAGDVGIWSVSALVRLASFILGGFVGVLLARGISKQLIAVLLILAVLATVFEQFPRTGSFMLVAVWSLAAPIGVVLGVWLANARSRVA
jgi:VIT1/CCC1 family predicted Fe2+/Mn2+ transporter